MGNNIRTRLAPSPTGRLHIGSLQKVIFCYAQAKKYGGKYILRIEDTDQTRLVEGSEEEIYRVHEIFGFEVDESPEKGGKFGPYKQSERLDLYKKYAEALIDKGAAYYAFETPEELDEMRRIQQVAKERPHYDGKYRDYSIEEAKERVSNGEKYVIRAKLPKDQEIKFTDMIMGEIKVSTNDMDDYILMKSDGFPTYHLAVVVDDHLMEISHVFRGVEWLPTAPLHIFLYQQFGWNIPEFAHIPNILNPNGKGKLSKRHGDVAVYDFVSKGYLPEAIINFMTLLGWAPSDDREIFTMDEFIEMYDESRFNKSNPVFNVDKLNWFNGQYIRAISNEDFLKRFLDWAETYHSDELEESGFKSLDESKKLEIVGLEQSRLTLLSELFEKIKTFTKLPEDYEFDTKQIKKLSSEEKLAILQKYMDSISSDPDIISSHEKWENSVRAISESMGFGAGKIFMTIRIAITGKSATPPLYEFINVIGSEEHVNRLKKAIEFLHG